MGNNPFIEARRINKMKLLELYKSSPEMKKDQIIGVFSLKTGLRSAVIIEYWKELVMAGIIVEV